VPLYEGAMIYLGIIAHLGYCCRELRDLGLQRMRVERAQKQGEEEREEGDKERRREVERRRGGEEERRRADEVSGRMQLTN